MVDSEHWCYENMLMKEKNTIELNEIFTTAISILKENNDSTQSQHGRFFMLPFQTYLKFIYLVVS